MGKRNLTELESEKIRKKKGSNNNSKEQYFRTEESPSQKNSFLEE
jgi:hypothetical protein